MLLTVLAVVAVIWFVRLMPEVLGPSGPEFAVPVEKTLDAVQLGLQKLVGEHAALATDVLGLEVVQLRGLTNMMKG